MASVHISLESGELDQIIAGYLAEKYNINVRTTQFVLTWRNDGGLDARTELLSSAAATGLMAFSRALSEAEEESTHVPFSIRTGMPG